MKIFYILLFLLLSSIGYSQSPCLGLDSINYSGQWYHTVQIGSQCWLKENLNVGIMTPAVKDQTNNDTIEKFCYNNDPAMCDIYGGLYQWRETMQYTMKEDARGICPIGWHIPSISEFGKLSQAVGGDGNALKQVGQGQGTNTSGFSCLLSGNNQLTNFTDLGTSTSFWNSDAIFFTQRGYLQPYIKIIWYNSAIQSTPLDAVNGYSVRCLMDSVGLILQAPYGGESWKVGSTQRISWGGSNLNSKKIKIELTTDNGLNWAIVIDSYPASEGNYNWTIPNTQSNNCKVKITDNDNSGSYSISDNLFSIYSNCFAGSTVQHGGQTYNTVVLGNQCWLKENLNVGTMVPGSKTSTTNGIIEKYCYNDDTANCTKYGGLYAYSEMKEPNLFPVN